MTIQSLDGFYKLSQEHLDLIIKTFHWYLETTSTKKLLINGVCVITTTCIIKSWLNQLRQYKKNNLNGPLPLPLFGNLVHLMVHGLGGYHKKMANKYGKNFLSFEGLSPVVCISDAEFVKQITTKDVRIFPMRRTFRALENYIPFDQMLTQVNPERWKHIRALLTAGFTAGKLKIMSSTMLNTCNIFAAHLDNLIAKNQTFDAYKLYSHFACDIVCSSFFGVDVNTINDDTYPLPKMISKLFGKDILKDPKIILLTMFPAVASFLNDMGVINLFDQEAINYLINLSNQIIEERRSGRTKRNDFIQFMVEHEEKTDHELSEIENETNLHLKHLKKTLTNSEILSQSVLFMMVGTDTTANTLSWVSHNLALNMDVQEKLIEEVDTILDKYNGQITYEAVTEMHYMNSVIAETQRMYTVEFTDREACEDYEYKGTKIMKGQVVNILLKIMTHDESVFPEADKFNPERNLDFDQFMPFGSGPRTCIAQRFALLEIKLLLSTILSKFRFERCDKTDEKPGVDSSGLSKPAKPIILKVVRR